MAEEGSEEVADFIVDIAGADIVGTVDIVGTAGIAGGAGIVGTVVIAGIVDIAGAIADMVTAGLCRHVGIVSVASASLLCSSITVNKPYQLRLVGFVFVAADRHGFSAQDRLKRVAIPIAL